LESKGTFFILIIVVAVLALTLAALAGYLFLVQGSPVNKGEAVAAASTATVKKVPAEGDLVKVPLYDGKRYFNLKNNDPKKIAMMQVNVVLSCYKALKEKENKKVVVEEKVAAYSDEIQELVVRFFLTKTIDDVKDVQIMDKAKEELRKEINSRLNQGEKKPEEIVYEVIFSEWLFQ
jgi:flagellar basal body-associated protein FliL